MLQVLVGVGLVVGVWALLDSEKQAQHERYQRKARQVRWESEQHRQTIAKRMQQNQVRQEYHQAIAEHYAAVQTGNQMFELYDCAKQTLNALIEQAKICQQKIEDLKQQRKSLKGELREQVHQLLEQQYQLYQQIKEAIQHYKVEKNQHWQELQQLNHETHRLKLYIRDQLGQHGRDWFARLEMRRA